MEFCKKYPGGTELEISMLFADIRNSTRIAEGMRAAEFSRLLNRFYKQATGALIKNDAYIDKFVGDEVIGLFFPLFAGKNHAAAAVRAAQEMLRVAKYNQPAGQALPMGIGVHTGIAYVGTVSGAEGSAEDVTALGDNVNVTARLSSQAGEGEALVSEAAYAAAGLDFAGVEQRQLALKGKSEPVGVRVLKS
jgi:adenylate cyclase